MSEPAPERTEEPKRRARPAPKRRRRRAQAAPAAPKAIPRAETPLADSARRNTHAAFSLAGRLIGSQERVKEEDFEEVGRGLASIARDFPAARPYIESVVRALGPAATFGDLFEKVNRMVAKSKLKDSVGEKRANWQPPWKKGVPPGTDNTAGL